MTRRQLVLATGVAVALAAGATLRLATREQLRAGERTHPFSADANYHLRRARFAVAHYPATIFFDPLMNFPRGGVAIWPPLFDVALATPTRLLHGKDASAAALEADAAWVPLVFAGGAIVLAACLGTIVAGPLAGVAAAFFLALSPGHLLWSQFGHSDQHVAESFMGLLVLVLFLRARNARQPRARRRAELATGIALALATLTWQGAICWGAWIALTLFLEALRSRESAFAPALRILGLSALLLFGATAAWLGETRMPVTYISFGFFQPLFLAALAAGTILLDTGLAALRGKLTSRDSAARAVVLLAGGGILAPFAGELAAGLARGIGYMLGKTQESAAAGGYIDYPKDWLQGIFEAQPLLAGGPQLAWRQLSAAFFLSPVVLALWALRARRGRRAAFYLALSTWGALTLFLALSQRLNVYYAVPLAALCAIEIGRVIATRVRRFRGGRRFPRRLLAAAVGVALALPMLPALRDEVQSLHVPGSDLFATLDWMRATLPRSIDPYDPRLLRPEGASADLSRVRAVLAPWSLGHWILYHAERPVVANNFGYGFLDSVRFFLAESEEEALALARARRAGWILAADLVPRMNDYASYLGRAPYLSATQAGMTPSPAYFATMQARLYDFDGRGGRVGDLEVLPVRSLRLVYQSRTGNPRWGRWVARWKVFEILN